MLMVITLFVLSTSALGGASNLADLRIGQSYQDQCGLDSGLHITPNSMFGPSQLDSETGKAWGKAIAAEALATDALLQNPGDGMTLEDITPFQKVLKDGFMKVGCVKDDMYYKGDKHGANKHQYNQGKISGASIVHYDAFIAKLDRKPMSHNVCFEFCRTVPGMIMFGIINGRGCYCSPFYKEMASDSSMCDSPCEGAPNLMCGGAEKSTVFAMHKCGDTDKKLTKKTDKAARVKREMDAAISRATLLSTKMQNMAADLESRFGAVGDSSAVKLMQTAQLFARDMVRKTADAQGAIDKLGNLSAPASTLTDFSIPATVARAERIMEGIDVEVVTNIAVYDQLATLEAFAVGESGARDMNIAEPKPQPPSLNASGHVIEAKLLTLGEFCAGPFGYFEAASLEDCTKKVISAPPEKCAGGHFDYAPHSNGAEGGGGCYCQRTGNCTDRVTSSYYSTFKLWVPPKPPVFEKHYYPVMHFVDKQFEKVPQTCSGPVVGKPIVGKTIEECAAACSANIHTCVGFQHFKDVGKALCFLFSGFTTGTYYSGCDVSGSSSFLQSAAKAPFQSMCYAKLSKFLDTTLKPDPSGKCKQCFKKVTKANRCYK